MLKPLLIHKYEKDKEARAREFYDMFQAEGNQVRKLYEQKKTLRLDALSEKASSRRSKPTETQEQ